MIADCPLRWDRDEGKRNDVGHEGHDQQIGPRSPERLEGFRRLIAFRLVGRDAAAVGGDLQGVGLSPRFPLGEPGGDDLFPPVR